MWPFKKNVRKRKETSLRCLYCDGTKFYEGPQGGAAMNVLCANAECRHWFNWVGTRLDDLHSIEPKDPQP